MRKLETMASPLDLVSKELREESRAEFRQHPEVAGTPLPRQQRLKVKRRLDGR